MNDYDSKQEKDFPARAKGLKSVGKFYFNDIVYNVDSLLELHRRDTLSTFGTRTSERQFRVGSGSGNDSENNSNIIMCSSHIANGVFRISLLREY